jgi:predicted nucleotidyltransferase
MKLDFEKEIMSITKQLIEKDVPEKIILFGSAARGDIGPDSDADFLSVNDLRHSRRLVICEPLKAVVNHGPPQRWRLFA